MAANPASADRTSAAAARGRTHAAVIGGGVAGLLCARVLAGHVGRVTLVERDALPDGAEDRRGVPQGRQLHLLLPRGRQVVDRLFPGYSAELLARGAVPLDVPRDVRLLSRFGWLDRRAPGWEALSASRPLIEAVLRRRVRELPNVDVLERHEATGLGTLHRAGVVDAVRIRDLDDGHERWLEAELVADAAGRGSRAPHWLADLGFPAPEQTHVDPDVAYATRVYRVPDGSGAEWKAVMLGSRPPTMPRTGYLFPIEGGRCMVTLIGAAGQHPPTDEAGFAEFAASLPHPVIADTIRAAEPVTPVRGHRGTANRRWHFEQMSRWPEGFVVVGDAVCAFNPVYGQGMTVAALGAEALDDCLRDHVARHRAPGLGSVAARVQKQLARCDADAWMLSTGEDLRFPTTAGAELTPVTRVMHRYLDRVLAAATEDPDVADAYVRVFGMVDRPATLFRPAIAAAAARVRPRAVVPAAPDGVRRREDAGPDVTVSGAVRSSTPAR